MHSVLVTGGLGFIGVNLIEELLKKYFVINIDKVSYSSNNPKIFSKKKNYVFFKKDINDKNFFINILKKFKPKIVFNLAAETHVDRSIDNSLPFIRSNILGTINLLEGIKAVKKKIRFIHISTDEVYGDISKNKNSKETHRYNPSSPYASSKASADLIIKSYFKTYKLDVVITNCCNNYGPYQYPEKLVPKIIYNIDNNKFVPIYDKGKNVREWIFVKDHCNALIKVSKYGLRGESYNIGSGIRLSNLEITKKIFSQIKKKIPSKKLKINFVKDRPGHDFRYSINSNKIKKNLKWKCMTTLNKGLKTTVDWYIQKFKLKFYSNKKFNKRLGVIK